MFDATFADLAPAELRGRYVASPPAWRPGRTPWPRCPGRPNHVYYGSVPRNPAKTVRFVTLPTSAETDGNLHVFAMAIG